MFDPRAVLGVILLIPACSGLDEHVLLLPEPRGESGLLAISDDDSLEVIAFVPTEGLNPFVRSFEGETTFEVLHYEEPLSELMLDEGRLPRSPGSSRRIPPNPLDIFVTGLSEEGKLREWASSRQVSAALSAFELPEIHPVCPELEFETISSTLEPTAILPDPNDDGAAIIFTETTSVAFRFDVSTRELRELAVSPAPARPVRPYFATPEELLLGAEQIYRATVTESEVRLEAFLPESLLEGVVASETGTAAVTYRRLAGEIRPDGALELLGLDVLGRVWSLDIEGKRLLHAFADPMSTESTSGGLVRIGPSEYLASNQGATTVAHIREGEVSFEDASEGTFELIAVEDLGVVGGGAAGRFLFREDGVWRSERSSFGVSIRFLLPFGAGRFLFGGLDFAGRWSDGVFCALFVLPSASLKSGSVVAGHLLAGTATDLILTEVVP